MMLIRKRFENIRRKTLASGKVARSQLEVEIESIVNFLMLNQSDLCNSVSKETPGRNLDKSQGTYLEEIVTCGKTASPLSLCS